MVFREVSVIEIREVLRSWLAGAGLRKVAAQAGVDRKTARRYVEAAVAAGLARDGGPGQLSDELVGQVDLPRAFRTADLWLIHAADCCSRYSSWTCCGVRY